MNLRRLGLLFCLASGCDRAWLDLGGELEGRDSGVSTTFDAGGRDAALPSMDASTGITTDGANVQDATSPNDGNTQSADGGSGALADAAGDASRSRDASPDAGPVIVQGKATHLTVGGDATCTILDDGRVACWGRNDFGQLAITTENAEPSCGNCQITPKEIPNLMGAAHISLGLGHGCGLIDGSVRCWGSNAFGELAQGDSDLGAHPTPVSVGLTDVVEIATGRGFSCALKQDGTVWCWGLSISGQMGIDPAPLSRCTVPAARLDALGVEGRVSEVACSPTPRQIPGLAGVSAIALGAFHACALIDGDAYCWGQNNVGQIGNGQQASRAPASALQLDQVSALSLGAFHSCALRNGTLLCWGQNLFGQLGLSSAPGVNIVVTGPTAVPGLTGISRISAGDAHSCLWDGTLRCAGANEALQLGASTVDSCTINALPTPCSRGFIAGPTFENLTDVGTGDAHTCVLLADGDVYCWGENAYGQLGRAPLTSTATPVRALGP